MRRPSLLALLPLGALLGTVPLVALQACGGGSSTDTPAVDGGALPDVATGDAGDDTQADVPFELDGGGMCPAGSACGDGGAGKCVGGNVCCDRALACGDACCATGSVCSFGKCATPGAVCVDATECKPTEICDYSLGTLVSGDAGLDGGGDAGGASCKGGAAQKSGRCHPGPRSAHPPAATPASTEETAGAEAARTRELRPIS